MECRVSFLNWAYPCRKCNNQISQKSSAGLLNAGDLHSYPVKPIACGAAGQEKKTARVFLHHGNLDLREVLHGCLHCFDRIIEIFQFTVHIGLVRQHIEVPMAG
jgi:hypothetical protein